MSMAISERGETPEWSAYMLHKQGTYSEQKDHQGREQWDFIIKSIFLQLVPRVESVASSLSNHTSFQMAESKNLSSTQYQSHLKGNTLVLLIKFFQKVKLMVLLKIKPNHPSAVC